MSQVCPHLPSHHTFFGEVEEHFEGSKSPFFVGCNSFTNSGYLVCKSLNPERIFLPEQNGQPVFAPALWATVVFHS